MIFYFSGTGNSQWVAQQLAEALCEIVHPITGKHSNKIYSLQPGERVGFVFPVYSWAPPEVVLRWIASLQFNQVPEYIYFVCTCGDDTGKTPRIFRQAVADRGWVCHAGFSVVMPNTYVCLPGFDVDSQELQNRKITQAKERISQLKEWIIAKVSRFDCHEGSMPFVKSYVLRPFFNRFLTSPRAFHVKDTCISCGKCEQVCPLHNIQLENSKPVWGANCSMCLACYHHCPTHAIAYGKQTQKKGQYVFRESL